MGSTEVFARVVFPSPLPALDREFDYKVPAHLVDSIRLGCRVKVPFAGQTKEGFVVLLSPEPSFAGSISSITDLVSDVPVLAPHVYSLLKSVAQRQCCSVGELLENAVPKRSVRIEKSFTEVKHLPIGEGLGRKTVELVRPVFDSASGLPGFVPKLAKLAAEKFEQGLSVIVCVPDFRDLERVGKALENLIAPESLTVVNSADMGSKRYDSFLRQLSGQPQVVLGTRSAIYSPVSSSAALIIWDDGDQSHQDQQAPYLTTREIALIRQSLFNCDLHFLSHARSTEVQRLVEIGYVEEVPSDNWRPKVAIAEGRGLEGTSFKAIKAGLEKGPVLFQVAAPGKARSLYCVGCNERSKCVHCNGPLWLNASGQIVCRWCGKFNLDFECHSCQSRKLSQGAAGATRWVEQLGKSFPGVPVREITADSPTEEVGDKPALIVSTPGIEPIAKSGYAVVVLIDCSSQLSRDSLRAPEDALRDWLNALAFMRSDGQAVAVGVSEEVSRALSLGEVTDTVSRILQEREELGFPPAKRILSATGSLETVNSLGQLLGKIGGVTVLGVAEAQTSTNEKDFRLLASFNYAAGSNVAKEVRAFLLTLSSKAVRVNARSGRAVRPLTIKFDDPRVL